MSKVNWDSEILDKLHSIVYVSDMDSYELLYLNRQGRSELGLPVEGDICGKCYEVLQKLDEPCGFCNNETLRKEKYCVRTHFNQPLDRYFMAQDTLLTHGGRSLRMEIGSDITKMETDALQTRDYLEMERNLVRCIRRLTVSDDLESAISSVMASILEYYQGDRAYIFEFDWENRLAHNTYEQCAAGVTPEIENLRNVPQEALHVWIKMFGRQKYVYIDDLEKIKDDPARRDEYDTLAPQGIYRLLTVPFYYKEELQGFLGVDNPKSRCQDFHYLQTLTYFINNTMEKSRMNLHLQRMSYYDILTGTRNRNSYNEKITALEKQPPDTIGVAFVDMNGLKYINDTVGHAYGDKALLQLVGIVREFFSDKNIYRISGDEFVLLCPDWSKEVFEQAITNLMQNIRKDNNEIAAIGYLWNNGNDDVHQLVNRAEQMMYVNKQSYYAGHPGSRSRHRPPILDALLNDLEMGSYCVYFQPKAAIDGCRVYGAEALVRKMDADGRVVLPYEFIELMERERVISKIDFFVLEEVCRTMKGWKKRGLPPMHISVNISRVTLVEENFIRRVVETCDRYGVDHGCIELEITESSEAIDNRRMKEIIGELQAAGYSVSLDDMGMEYSSLRLISIEGVKVINLDRSFILMMEQGRSNRILVEQIIKLCHAMGRTCVAEGVDTEEQLALLHTMGCDSVQGYLLSPPVPLAEFEARFLETE